MVQWLILLASDAGDMVPSLVGELKSHMWCGQKNLKINKIKVSFFFFLSLHIFHILDEIDLVPCALRR